MNSIFHRYSKQTKIQSLETSLKSSCGTSKKSHMKWNRSLPKNGSPTPFPFVTQNHGHPKAPSSFTTFSVVATSLPLTFGDDDSVMISWIWAFSNTLTRACIRFSGLEISRWLYQIVSKQVCHAASYLGLGYVCLMYVRAR